MADLPTTVKDAAYVTVGLGVLGFQKAQERRVELTKQLEEQRKQLREQRKQLEGQLTEITKVANGQFSTAAKLVEQQVGEAATTVKHLARDLDTRLAPVREQLEESIDALEVRLPPPARGLVQQARTVAHETEGQVRQVLGLRAPAA
jgi:DNA anti-recombination protein RmuC